MRCLQAASSTLFSALIQGLAPSCAESSCSLTQTYSLLIYFFAAWPPKETGHVLPFLSFFRECASIDWVDKVELPEACAVENDDFASAKPSETEEPGETGRLEGLFSPLLKHFNF